MPESTKLLSEPVPALRDVAMGKLRNGGRPLHPDLLRNAPRCHAKRKRDGQPCQAPAAKGSGVCRVHGAGGGPKTAAGRQRCSEARMKHGRRSAAFIAASRSDRIEVRRLKAELKLIERGMASERREQVRQQPMSEQPRFVIVLPWPVAHP